MRSPRLGTWLVVALLALHGSLALLGPDVHALVPCEHSPALGSVEDPLTHPDTCPICQHHGLAQVAAATTASPLPDRAAEPVVLQAPRPSGISPAAALQPRAPPARAA